MVDYYYPRTFYPIYKKFKYLPHRDAFIEVWDLVQAEEVVKKFGRLRRITFQLNKFITLKLEREKTNIYVNDQFFNQCKTLLINIPKHKLHNYDQFNSIDEVAYNVNKSLENVPSYFYKKKKSEKF